MPADRFNIPFFYPSKAGGFFYQMSDNPKNDNNVDWPSEMTFSGPIATMHPNGPTDFGIGKYIASFSDSIGGCNMDFDATQRRGYAYKADDARDVEIKCLAKFSGIDSESGFSISACTGHHSSSGCCQGFAYMSTTEITHSPSDNRFRKEIWHVNYNETPQNSTVDLSGGRINNSNKYVGLCFCRYNTPGSEATSVTLEFWFNPDPTADINNWKMVNKYIDKPGGGWANSGDKCNGDKDQVGTWSNAQNRLKTNSTGGSINFKAVTLREIDPNGSFDQPPPPTTCPPGQHLSGGVCVPDTASGGGDTGGGTGGGAVGSPLSYTFGFKFGSNGSGNGQFLDPHDISFDASGDLFICDRGRSDVQKFTRSGTYISKFGGPGSGNGQFNVPYAIQHDPTFAFIYVCDKDNSRVQKLNSSGTWISNITTVNGQAFNKPEDITFDKVNGDIYILDTGNDRCVKLTSAHTFILQWGTTGSGNGQFQHPHSVNTDSNRDVFISCGNQPYIQKFTSTGTFIKKWGSLGDGPGQVRTFLEHMDIDLRDRVHLVNNDVRPIVNVWDNQGVWLTQYGKTTSGNADGQFKEPEHVTCDSTGKPYVVDAMNQRIQVFNVNESVAPPPSGPPPPTVTTRVHGFFRLLWNINTVAGIGACSGTGGGGGGGGGTNFEFYNVAAGGGTNYLNGNRTGVYEMCNSTSSIIYGKLPTQIDVYLMRVGSPTGTLNAVHRSAPTTAGGTDDYIKETFGTIDVSTISTTETLYSFGPIANTTNHIKLYNKVGVEYDNGDINNYITVSRYTVGPFDGTRACKVAKQGGKYVVSLDMDMAGIIYEG